MVGYRYNDSVFFFTIIKIQLFSLALDHVRSELLDHNNHLITITIIPNKFVFQAGYKADSELKLRSQTESPS